MSAIEALNRGPATPFRSPHARPFHLLHLHYVEGMTIQETARELGLSERQAYRDLRHADASIAGLMWVKRRPQAPKRSAAEPVGKTLSSVEDEMDRLANRAEPVDLGQLLDRVQRSVERLAAQHGVTLVSDIPVTPVTYLPTRCWGNRSSPIS